MNYRPEIDGLRAVAVVAVIFYHAQITILGHPPFQGGFIGVDIFFVISGYLITSIILKELVTTGSFSFKYFYERRIRRILPALLFVMLASLPFAWFFLLPISFVDFAKSILYSLGFSSNFYFHFSGQEYGAENGLLKPFLHTWSLSVEEQYYILIPILLVITLKYFSKYLLPILILGFVVSLGLAEWGSRNYPSISFYFIPTRMWELIAGSILAYFEITTGHRSKSKTLNLILPSIGLFLIGGSILFFDDEIFHPSFYTLIPVIGVCFIIWFSYSDEMVSKILSTKLFVGIGLISYSLYLWHYPIFAFSRYVQFTEGNFYKKIFLIFALLLVSILSFVLIERPFRNKKFKFKKILIIIFAFYIINFSSSLLLINKIPNVYKSNYIISDNLKESIKKNCIDVIKNFEKKCQKTNKYKQKIFIMGDSHMNYLSDDLSYRLINKDYIVYTISHTLCFFFQGFEPFDIKTNKSIDSTKCANDRLNNIYNETNAIYIVGGRFPYVLNKSYFDNGEGGVEDRNDTNSYRSTGKYTTISESFISLMNQLSEKNKIILVYPIPEVGWHVPRLLNNNSNKTFDLKKYQNKFISTSFDVFKKRTQSTYELFQNIQSENIFRVYPSELLCNTLIKNRCIAHDNDNIFYVDDNHPSSKAIEMINNFIMTEIEKIEEIKNN